MNSPQYAIYNLPSYNVKKESFNSRKVELELQDVCDELENINGWHFRIDPSKQYIYYADIDGFDNDIYEFRDDIFELVNMQFGIKLENNDFNIPNDISAYNI